MQIYFGNKEVKEYEDKLEAIKAYFFKKKVIKKGSKSEVIRRLIDLVYNSDEYKEVMNGIVPPIKTSKDEEIEKTMQEELFSNGDQFRTKQERRVLISLCAGHITYEEYEVFNEQGYKEKDNSVEVFIKEYLGYESLESFLKERKAKKLRGSK